jgi:hypothetical protein
LLDNRSRSVSAAPVCEDSEEKLKRVERSTDLGIDAFPAQDMMDVEVITRTCICLVLGGEFTSTAPDPLLA